MYISQPNNSTLDAYVRGIPALEFLEMWAKTVILKQSQGLKLEPTQCPSTVEWINCGTVLQWNIIK